MSAIKNLNKLQRRLSDPTWISKPAGSFLQAWYSIVHDEAVNRAPEWKGDLKRSIRGQRDTKRFPLWARVFSDSRYAEFAEHGTGLLYDGPGGRRQRYFPNPKAIAPWAVSKGLNPWAVAYGIWKRGGTEPQHFFRDAERIADARIGGLMATFGRNIERQAALAAD